MDKFQIAGAANTDNQICTVSDSMPGKNLQSVFVRLRGKVRGDVDYCSERQPGRRPAATDYQWLDPDAEEVHRIFAVVRAELG